VQLQEHIGAFEEAGIGIVVITYDSPDLQQAFIEAGSITYPLISDMDTATMTALGILNEGYKPGEPAYGIPHPGIFVLNPEREIVGKIFVEDYAKRVNAEDTLAYALGALE
jgi:peroxiredoxin